MRADPSKIIPTSDSTSEQWVTWHKALRKWFTKNEANTHWLRFWQQRSGAGTKADTYDLREYMRSQDVDLTTTTMGEVTDMAGGIVEFFTDSINIARIILVGVVVVGVGLVVFYVVSSTRQGKSAAQMVIEARSLGGAKKLLS